MSAHAFRSLGLAQELLSPLPPGSAAPRSEGTGSPFEILGTVTLPLLAYGLADHSSGDPALATRVIVQLPPLRMLVVEQSFGGLDVLIGAPWIRATLSGVLFGPDHLVFKSSASGLSAPFRVPCLPVAAATDPEFDRRISSSPLGSSSDARAEATSQSLRTVASVVAATWARSSVLELSDLDRSRITRLASLRVAALALAEGDHRTGVEDLGPFPACGGWPSRVAALCCAPLTPGQLDFQTSSLRVDTSEMLSGFSRRRIAESRGISPRSGGNVPPPFARGSGRREESTSRDSAKFIGAWSRAEGATVAAVGAATAPVAVATKLDIERELRELEQAQLDQERAALNVVQQEEFERIRKLVDPLVTWLANLSVAEPPPAPASAIVDESIVSVLPEENRLELIRLVRELAAAFPHPTIVPRSASAAALPHPVVFELLPVPEGSSRHRPSKAGLKRQWRDGEKRDALIQQVRALIQSGLVQCSSSEWAHAVVMVKKKDGRWRLCLDFRALNSITASDVYPLPDPDDVARVLARAKFFSSMDLSQAFNQLEIAEADRHLTAFATPIGLFEFKVMALGLKRATATFQRNVEAILQPLLWKGVICFVDDLFIYADTEKDCLRLTRLVLALLRRHDLRVNSAKCRILVNEVDVLGRVIKNGSIAVRADRAQAFRDWIRPVSVSDMRRFLGTVQFVAQHVPDLSSVVQPLFRLERAVVGTEVARTVDNRPLPWDDEAALAFTRLIDVLASPAVLSVPTFHSTADLEGRVRIESDACCAYLVDAPSGAASCNALEARRVGGGVGGTLWWRDGSGTWRLVMARSRVLSGAELKYSAVEVELLGLWETYRAASWLTDKCSSVEAITDHHALAFLSKMLEATNPRLQRWSADLADSCITVRYRPGALNTVNDGISRSLRAASIADSAVPLRSLLAGPASARLRADLVSISDLDGPSHRFLTSSASSASVANSAPPPLLQRDVASRGALPAVSRRSPAVAAVARATSSAANVDPRSLRASHVPRDVFDTMASLCAHSVDVFYVDWPHAYFDNRAGVKNASMFSRVDASRWVDLQLDRVAALSCVLLVWVPRVHACTFPLVVLSSPGGWRFHTSLTWDRVHPAGSKRWPRQRCEDLFVFARGNIDSVLVASVLTTSSSLVVEPAREPGRKPVAMRELWRAAIKPQATVVELFAREIYPAEYQWICIGDEMGTFSGADAAIASAVSPSSLASGSVAALPPAAPPIAPSVTLSASTPMVGAADPLRRSARKNRGVPRTRVDDEQPEHMAVVSGPQSSVRASAANSSAPASSPLASSSSASSSLPASSSAASAAASSVKSLEDSGPPLAPHLAAAAGSWSPTLLFSSEVDEFATLAVHVAHSLDPLAFVTVARLIPKSLRASVPLLSARLHAVSQSTLADSSLQKQHGLLVGSLAAQLEWSDPVRVARLRQLFAHLRTSVVGIKGPALIAQLVPLASRVGSPVDVPSPDELISSEQLVALDGERLVRLPMLFLQGKTSVQRDMHSGVAHEVPLEFVPSSASWVLQRAARRMHLELAHLRRSVWKHLSYHTGLFAFDMQHLVDEALLACGACDRRKGYPHRWTAGAAHSPYASIRASFVGHFVQIDTVSMPLSKKGNKFLVSWTDLYSRWSGGGALQSLTADGVASILVESLLGLVGMPVFLISDQGPEFDNKVIRALAALCKGRFSYLPTTSRHPEGNSHQERANATISDCIATSLSQLCLAEDRWEEILPAARYAFHSAVHSATGQTPARLFLGRELIAIPFYDSAASQQREASGVVVVDRSSAASDVVNDPMGRHVPFAGPEIIDERNPLHETFRIMRDVHEHTAKVLAARGRAASRKTSTIPMFSVGDIVRHWQEPRLAQHLGVVSSKLLQFRWSEPYIILGFTPSRRSVFVARVDDPTIRDTITLQHLKHASFSAQDCERMRVRYVSLVNELKEFQEKENTVPAVDATSLRWKFDDSAENVFEFIRLLRIVGSPEHPDHKVEVLWHDGKKSMEPGVDIKRTASRAYNKLVHDWRASMGRARKVAVKVSAILNSTVA